MALIFIYAVHIILILELKVQLVDSFKEDGGVTAFDSEARDMATINMFKLYEKFNKDKQRHRAENTVRSFKAVSVFSDKVHFYFNLSSIPESEVILSSSLHFFVQHGRQRQWSCQRSRGSSCRLQHLKPPNTMQIILRGASHNIESSRHLLNLTLSSHRKGAWQMTDLASTVQRTRILNYSLILAEFYFGERQQQWQDRFSPLSLPYILVYSNDLSITEPKSIAMSLQRYGPFSVGEESRTRPPFAISSVRIRRDADNLQNNFIPDVQYNDFKNMELWHNTFFASKPKVSSKGHGVRQGHNVRNGGSRSQELNFDEKTMKKARRKQWSEPRVCARRYLRVDFADIGWNEWILAPKSFDAYYCAGTCGFPMPKVVRPSNHATIQSIVRAVGIIPGVPEPCCVPEKMSPLVVLFLDISKNMVLKVYPNMSVQTCSCQ